MSVSIVIPTYNRKNFEKLISYNILCQSYPFIKEIIIADDGLVEERLNINCPYPIVYNTIKRCSIGHKRNYLNQVATGDYIVHMDTDDFYHPEYISNSIYTLIKSKKQVAGSADMIMKRGDQYYKQRCLYIDMLNEATLVYTKKYAATHFFADASAGEGRSFLPDIKHIVETDIDTVMVCLVHDGNTVSKNAWLIDKYLMPTPPTIYDSHISIFKVFNIYR
tara:strand:+ start:1764 stop:2426 length:663 start_codon:yes stop_codon:yes gene_type:complete